jgi:predicted RNA binding protein YcfA (HicA-like mRNA interferase family)
VPNAESGNEKAEEIKTLLETGFEYVCQKDSLVFLRKRK